ncbi:peroxide stress protein YaaA [Flavobacterium sp. NKUCC04_CG]|uniref:peroxide stress protein YaaA n=1 Tax=Flavobacterium sp. NKUCC04_CG TaxID=2842121 RepID=UPI001C5BDE5F|nr:peroxide stress protein YaaA [Flavobacterium sp. NKUCC04_CG]MBW3519698.1 peroxide stress protein YaaA [Flavobacterium sp. NKUCC04_CG]
MKILISPAKSLDYNTAVPFSFKTEPIFKKQVKLVNEVLKTYSQKDLADLMHISAKLAELNWTRNQERTLKTTAVSQNVRAAVYAFNGDVYSGLDAYTLNEEQCADLQLKLRILSGLYGLLKPFDFIEPYRLEMGTKMSVGESANLYEFWKPLIAAALNKEMKKGELLINLASVEYFSAVDKKALVGQLVTPDFKELRAGKLKSISFFAKKARGMMVRYIIENQIETIEGLKGFDTDGYAFSADNSTENKLVFIR